MNGIIDKVRGAGKTSESAEKSSQAPVDTPQGSDPAIGASAPDAGGTAQAALESPSPASTSGSTPAKAGKSGKPKRQFHVVTQGKGGAGKTFIASLLCQAMRRQGRDWSAYDLDPVNNTLAGIKGLGVKAWDLFGDDGAVDKIDPFKFDKMMEEVLQGKGDVIVDVGATAFLPFNQYMLDTSVFKLLQEHADMRGVVHCVVRSGAGLIDCLNGLAGLCLNYNMPTQLDLVVWLNEVEGPVIGKDGKKFEEMKIYTRNSKLIKKVVRLREERSELVQDDMRRMLRDKLTFSDVRETGDFTLLSSMRLRTSAEKYLGVADEVINFLGG